MLIYLAAKNYDKYLMYGNIFKHMEESGFQELPIAIERNKKTILYPLRRGKIKLESLEQKAQELENLDKILFAYSIDQLQERLPIEPMRIRDRLHRDQKDIEKEIK